MVAEARRRARRRPASFPYDRLRDRNRSSPVVPPVVEGLDYWTNKEATETTTVPGTLLVLGGGPVGCELAQFFARVGSKVTLVQDDERLLPHVDADAAALVHAALEEDGVEVRVNEESSDEHGWRASSECSSPRAASRTRKGSMRSALTVSNTRDRGRRAPARSR